MITMYFWGEDGVIRETSNSLLEVVAMAIDNNTREYETSIREEPDSCETDAAEDVALLKELFQRFEERGFDCQYTVRNGEIMHA